MSKDSFIDSMIISMIESVIVLSIFSKTVFAVSVLQKHFIVYIVWSSYNLHVSISAL